mmetsp:Transcript_30401/g.69994  ORF Transcript_30401/g.69994 Transcript_30401/m.69994 type:complete len:245 (-) Transcript_30401:35-769(-)
MLQTSRHEGESSLVLHGSIPQRQASGTRSQASSLALALCAGDGSSVAINQALASRGLSSAPPALPAPPPRLALPSTEAAAPSSLALASSSTALVPSSDRGSVGLKTSGGDLKSMLLSTGYKAAPLEGAEKLDLLVWMADQVKENVGKKRKMKLALEQLVAFLSREGMSPKRDDAKSIISELLSLRRRELERLDYSKLQYHQEQDHSFELALVAIPSQAVNECFALVPWQDPGETVKASRGCQVM